MGFGKIRRLCMRDGRIPRVPLKHLNERAIVMDNYYQDVYDL